MNINMHKLSKEIFLSGAILLTVLLSGCSFGKKQSTTDTTQTETSSEDTTIVTDSTKNASSDDTNVSESTSSTNSDDLLFGAGNYTYVVDSSTLSITFAATGDTDTTQYYDSYQWVCNLPPDYTYNKYSSSLVSFYDKDKGVFLASQGSGAGSSYYIIYATFDGGSTWVKKDDLFQKTNTSEELFFTDENTLVVFDLGIGLSAPTLNAFTIADDSITTLIDHQYLTELPNMLKSLTVTDIVDSTHFTCEYEIENVSTEQTCTIDLEQYFE